MIKHDCYAFRMNGDRAFCDVMDELVCRKRKCSFYTNKDEHEETARRAQERNQRLFPRGYKPSHAPRGKDGNHV